MKASYETIQLHAFYLLNRAALAKNIDTMYMFWESYVSYLEHCGWSEEEFDLEIIKNIDGAWTPQYN